MKTTNKQKLRDWLTKRGKGAKTELAFKAGCSTSLIETLLRPTFKKAPSPEFCYSISRVTGIPEKELFPEIPEEVANAKTQQIQRIEQIKKNVGRSS